MREHNGAGPHSAEPAIPPWLQYAAPPTDSVSAAPVPPDSIPVGSLPPDDPTPQVNTVPLTPDTPTNGQRHISTAATDVAPAIPDSAHPMDDVLFTPGSYSVPPQHFPPQPFPPLQMPPPQMSPTQMLPPQPIPSPTSPPPAPDGFGMGGYGAKAYGPDPTGPALDDVALLRKARRAPSRGWRRAVHTLSAGAINPGESAGDVRHQQLIDRLRQPVRGDYRIAVLSLKGGVGKTTTTVGLGSTFASLRGDRVIAVDANPDLGTLAQRIPQQTASTVRDLLADDNVYRYSDVRAHTSQAPSRLEVLASERDPAMAEAFSEEEYRGVIAILQRFYNIIITDCGTGKTHH